MLSSSQETLRCCIGKSSAALGLTLMNWSVYALGLTYPMSKKEQFVRLEIGLTQSDLPLLGVWTIQRSPLYPLVSVLPH